MKKIILSVLMVSAVSAVSTAAFAQGPTPCLPPYKNCTPRPPIAKPAPKKISLSF
jgi:hypothetical protein